MVKSLRDAFVEALARSERSEADIALHSDIPLERLRRLVVDPSTHISVEDAVRLARCFGSSLDEFLDAPRLKSQVEIAHLYNQLPEALKRQFQACASGQTE